MCGNDRDDDQFFQAEVVRLLDRLYGMALRLTGNGTDAEDLVAESVARAWEAFPRLRDRQAFPRWMFRILANVFVSDWRRRQANPVSELPDEHASDASDEFSLYRRLHQPFLLWWGTPEKVFLNKLLREDIERALDALPDHYRVVMVLVVIQGFSYAEAAETLDLPVGTVRSRLSRARSLLQQALWTHAREAGLEAGAATALGKVRS